MAESLGINESADKTIEVDDLPQKFEKFTSGKYVIFIIVAVLIVLFWTKVAYLILGDDPMQKIMSIIEKGAGIITDALAIITIV